MTKILDWQRAEDPRDVIHLAVQALAEGHLVAFPSDVHYVVVSSGLRPLAVERLSAIAGTTDSPPSPTTSLLPRSADEIVDYVPDVSPIALRLAHRSWPGPLEIHIKNGHPASLISQLDPATQAKLYRGSNYLSLSIPRHESLDQVVRLSAGPLLVAPAYRTPDGDLAVEAQQVPGTVALAIDGGTTETPYQSTIVRVDGPDCRVQRAGHLSQEELLTMTQYSIVLICTGNTCRSPMAEVLLNHKLQNRFAAHFGDGLPPPIVARSAGVAASEGDRASEGAIAAMDSLGLDLRQHQSQPAHLDLLERADLILTMTSNHRQTLLGRWPQLAGKTFGLAPENAEVSDPYGGPVELYQACARKIDQYLDAWVERLDESLLANWSRERK